VITTFFVHATVDEIVPQSVTQPDDVVLLRHKDAAELSYWNTAVTTRHLAALRSRHHGYFSTPLRSANVVVVVVDLKRAEQWCLPLMLRRLQLLRSSDSMPTFDIWTPYQCSSTASQRDPLSASAPRLLPNDALVLSGFFVDRIAAVTAIATTTAIQASRSGRSGAIQALLQASANTQFGEVLARWQLWLHARVIAEDPFDASSTSQCQPVCYSVDQNFTIRQPRVLDVAELCGGTVLNGKIVHFDVAVTSVASRLLHLGGARGADSYATGVCHTRSLVSDTATLEAAVQHILSVASIATTTTPACVLVAFVSRSNVHLLASFLAEASAIKLPAAVFAVDHAAAAAGATGTNSSDGGGSVSTVLVRHVATGACSPRRLADAWRSALAVEILRRASDERKKVVVAFSSPDVLWRRTFCGLPSPLLSAIEPRATTNVFVATASSALGGSRRLAIAVNHPSVLRLLSSSSLADVDAAVNTSSAANGGIASIHGVSVGVTGAHMLREIDCGAGAAVGDDNSFASICGTAVSPRSDGSGGGGGVYTRLSDRSGDGGGGGGGGSVVSSSVSNDLHDDGERDTGGDVGDSDLEHDVPLTLPPELPQPPVPPPPPTIDQLYKGVRCNDAYLCMVLLPHHRYLNRLSLSDTGREVISTLSDFGGGFRSARRASGGATFGGGGELVDVVGAKFNYQRHFAATTAYFVNGSSSCVDRVGAGDDQFWCAPLHHYVVVLVTPSPPPRPRNLRCIFVDFDKLSAQERQQPLPLVVVRGDIYRQSRSDLHGAPVTVTVVSCNVSSSRGDTYRKLLTSIPEWEIAVYGKAFNVTHLPLKLPPPVPSLLLPPPPPPSAAVVTTGHHHDGVHLCLSPLFGNARNGTAITAAQRMAVLEWVAYHWEIGVRHMWLYLDLPVDSASRLVAAVDELQRAWRLKRRKSKSDVEQEYFGGHRDDASLAGAYVHDVGIRRRVTVVDFSSLSNVPVWYHRQVLAYNDCLLRARQHRAAYVANLDFDEFLIRSAGNGRLASRQAPRWWLWRDALSNIDEHQRSATLGMSLASHSLVATATSSAAESPLRRANSIAEHAYLYTSTEAWRSKRKLMVSPFRAPVLNIHAIDDYEHVHQFSVDRRPWAPLIPDSTHRLAHAHIDVRKRYRDQDAASQTPLLDAHAHTQFVASTLIASIVTDAERRSAPSGSR